MNINDIVGMVPQEKRSEVEKCISEAIAAGNVLAGVDSQDKALELIQKTPILKSAYDAGISKTVAEHDDRFVKEKVPGLVDAKIRELNPPKDPRDIKIAELEAKFKEREESEKRLKLQTIALKIANDEKIPSEHIERFIGDDEKTTAENVLAYAASIKGWHNSGVEIVLKEKLGNVGKPGGGQSIPPADLKAQYEAASKAGNGMEMLRLKSLMQAEAEKTK